jgi:hypothetical protein
MVLGLIHHNKMMSVTRRSYQLKLVIRPQVTKIHPSYVTKGSTKCPENRHMHIVRHI